MHFLKGIFFIYCRFCQFYYHHFTVNALNMFNQFYYLCDIIITMTLAVFGIPDLSLNITHLTDDVGDCITSFDPATSLRVDPESHMDVGEAFLVWIILRIFCQTLQESENKRLIKQRNKM